MFCQCQTSRSKGQMSSCKVNHLVANVKHLVAKVRKICGPLSTRHCRYMEKFDRNDRAMVGIHG